MATLAKRGTTSPAESGVTWAGQSNLFDGAPGTNPGTVCTWVSGVAFAVGWIEISGFGFSSLGASDTLNSVTLLIRHQQSQTTRFSSINVQGYSGGAAVGTNWNAPLSTAMHDSFAAIGPFTMAQLRASDFKVRITATRTSGTIGSTFYIDHVDVTADYTAGVAAAGRPKVYVGGAFTKKPLKVYNGTSFVEKPVKVWTGSVWKTLT